MIPRRVEHQIDIGFGDGRNHLELGAHILDEDLAHAATRCRQGHADIDLALAIFRAFQIAVIDQAQFDDVDGDFRIKTGAQLRPDQFLDVLVACVCRQLQGLRNRLADGIGILSGDAEQVSVNINGKAAAQRLRDVAGLSGRQGHFVALRHHHGSAITLEANRF